MKSQKAVTWLFVLTFSALAWGDAILNHAKLKLDPKELTKALEEIRKGHGGQRLEGPTRAQEMMKRLNEWSLKLTNEGDLKALEGAAVQPLTDLAGIDLLNAFASQSVDVLKRIDAYNAEETKLRALNKALFDLEADAALKAERLYLTQLRQDVSKLIRGNRDSIDDPIVKRLLVEIVVRMNQDRALIGYGKEMLTLSQDPKFTEKDTATKRFLALARLQQTELKNSDILKNTVTHVGGKPLYPATVQTETALQAFQTIFSVKEDQVDADTLRLGQEVLFNRHIPTIILSYRKMTGADKPEKENEQK